MLTVKDVNRLDLPKQDNYERALAIGLEKFSRKDPGWIAERAGGAIRDGNLVTPHLNMNILLNLGSRKFTISETGEEAPSGCQYFVYITSILPKGSNQLESLNILENSRMALSMSLHSIDEQRTF